MDIIMLRDGKVGEFSAERDSDQWWGKEDEDADEGAEGFRARMERERIALAEPKMSHEGRGERRYRRRGKKGRRSEDPLADRECTLCEGSGVVSCADGIGSEECGCVPVERARRYLTTRYADVGWCEDFDKEPWDGSVLYIGPLDAFRRMVKTALANFGGQYSHQSVQPHDIVQRLYAFYRSHEKTVFEELKEVDILIVNFIVDPPYQDFMGTVGHILNGRAAKGRRTWVHSRLDSRTDEWKDLYGPSLKDVLFEPGRYHHIGETTGGFREDVERHDQEEEGEEVS